MACLILRVNYRRGRFFPHLTTLGHIIRAHQFLDHCSSKIEVSLRIKSWLLSPIYPNSFPYGMRLRMFCGSQGSRFCGFVRATHATLRVHACRRSLETMACMEVILFSAQLRTVRKERTSRRWHGNMSEELRFDSPSTTSCSRREYISTLEPWNTEIR
jgi:hypothetical protein